MTHATPTGAQGAAAADAARRRTVLRLVRAHGALFIALLALLAVAGCGPGAGGGGSATPWRVAHALIEDEPTELGLRIEITERERIFRWEFATEADVAPWLHRNLDNGFNLEDDGLYFRTQSPDPFFIRDCAIDASAVQHIRVHHSGLTSGAYMQIYWAREGEDFAESRSLTVEREEPGDPLVPIYDLPVFRHPEWTGTIVRFRIDPLSIADRRVQLYAIEGWKDQVDGGRLAAATTRPFKVDLGGDVRDALLGAPGIAQTRTLDVPADGAPTLRLAYGLQQIVGPPVRFRVRVGPAVETSDSDAAGATATDASVAEATLLDETLVPVERAADARWVEHSLSLADYAGKRLQLTLETAADDDSVLDLTHGFPVWADPQIVHRAAEDDRPPNVIIVLIDTLRADRLSLYGYERETSPRLTQWAQERGAVFKTVVAPSPWTLPSHVSLFTGLDTLSHGVNYAHAAPQHLTFLAEHLREAGYTTGAFTGGAYLTASYGLAQGFQRLHYESGFEGGGDRPTAGKDLDANLARVEAWLADVPEPYFLFFHTYDVHAPYLAHSPFYEQFYPDDAEADAAAEAKRMITTQPIRPVRAEGYLFRSRFVEPNPDGQGLIPLRDERKDALDAMYDSGIARVDKLLGTFFDQLDATGHSDRSVTVVASDHGEGLGEVDQRGEVSAGHANLYDHNLLVPLVVAWPDRRHAGASVDRQVRLIDVFPTLLESVGLPLPVDLDGRSLTPLLSDASAPFPREAYSYAGSSNFGLSVRLDDRLKYIYNHAAWQPLHGQRGLYDLRADPFEQLDRSAEHPQTSAIHSALRRRYDEAGARLAVELVNNEDMPMHAVLRGKLAHAFTTKAFDLPCAECVRWVRGEMRVDVPRRSRVAFNLEGLPRGELKVALRVGPRGRAVARRTEVMPVFTLLDGPRAWQFEGSALIDVEAVLDEPLEETGLRLVWQGSTEHDASADVDPAALDPALRERLRNLGYIQ
ncbi:MAG: sulfatase [Acidobacteriota bacterium]